MGSTTRKPPRDLGDAEVERIVADADAALERGDVLVVEAVVLRELRAAAALRRDAEQRVEAAVLSARQAGASWGLIGAQLGVTRQGARQRFERLVET
jgi:hypothetical protein